jgi:transcriptional regulator GlxA family with amidase domain
MGLGAVSAAFAAEPVMQARAIALPDSAAKLAPPADGSPIPVAFAISAATTNIDWVGPEAVFQIWRYDAASKKHVPRFKLFTVSDKLEPASHIIPDYTFDTAPQPRVIVVPAQRGSEALTNWLRKQHEQRLADVIMSVCVGARHLARAGLLDGKEATTYHDAVDDLAKEHPQVKWVRNVRFVEHEGISTGGGLTAGIDLAIRVVQRYFGRDTAEEVAAALEYQGRGWVVG